MVWRKVNGNKFIKCTRLAICFICPEEKLECVYIQTPKNKGSGFYFLQNFVSILKREVFFKNLCHTDNAGMGCWLGAIVCCTGMIPTSKRCCCCLAVCTAAQKAWGASAHWPVITINRSPACRNRRLKDGGAMDGARQMVGRFL